MCPDTRYPMVCVHLICKPERKNYVEPATLASKLVNVSSLGVPLFSDVQMDL